MPIYNDLIPNRIYSIDFAPFANLTWPPNHEWPSGTEVYCRAQYGYTVGRVLQVDKESFVFEPLVTSTSFRARKDSVCYANLKPIGNVYKAFGNVVVCWDPKPLFSDSPRLFINGISVLPNQLNALANMAGFNYENGESTRKLPTIDKVFCTIDYTYDATWPDVTLVGKSLDWDEFKRLLDFGARLYWGEFSDETGE